MSPELTELLKRAASHKMIEAEIIEQRKSWVRGMTTGCEHGVLDFETCPQCLTNQQETKT
jgi:dihydroorotase